jgi:hypothetical protein
MSTSPDQLQREIRNIEDFGDSTFRRFEWDLVSHYRRHEEDQQWIATALTDKRARIGVRDRERILEILAMLEHVHDPFITGQ